MSEKMSVNFFFFLHRKKGSKVPVELFLSITVDKYFLGKKTLPLTERADNIH
jgi:hypothetical protein